MKSLRILICSILLFSVFMGDEGNCQPFSVRTGLYIFTDNTSSEFYLLAPTLLAGYDLWKKSRLSLNLASGLSFNSFKYNDHRHNLYMVPLMVTVNYGFLNPGTRVRPFIGMGMELMGKADQNRDFEKTIWSLTYGYHATGGLRWRLNRKLLLTFDMTWNLLMPPVMEDVNMSGIILMVGVKI